MIDSSSKKTQGCETKVSSLLPNTSEHLPSSRKVAPDVKRSTTVRRISSYSASGDRIINNGVRRRCVSFAGDVQQVGEVSSRSELSEFEFSDLWYTKEDFKAIKSAFQPTVMKMAKNLPLSEDEEQRGLEYCTPRGSRSRKDNRYQAMDAVLDEQERQWEQDRKDTLYLAKLYRQSSAHCQTNAYLVAQKDAEYVEQIRNEEATNCKQQEDEMKSTILIGSERMGGGSDASSYSDNESILKVPTTPTTLNAAKRGVTPTKTLKASVIISACDRFGRNK